MVRTCIVFLMGKSSVFCIFFRGTSVSHTLFDFNYFSGPYAEDASQQVMLCQVTSRGRRHNSPSLVIPRQDSKILICFLSSLEAPL